MKLHILDIKQKINSFNNICRQNEKVEYGIIKNDYIIQLHPNNPL